MDGEWGVAPVKTSTGGGEKLDVVNTDTNKIQIEKKKIKVLITS